VLRHLAIADLARRPWIGAAFFVACAAGATAIDYWTGDRLSVLPLYAAPVALAGWLVHLRAGLAAAVTSALGLLLVGSIEAPGRPGLSYWNAVAAGSVLAGLAVAIARGREVILRERAAARFDPLTGARTQRDFYESVDLEIRRAERSPRPITLAYIDVDDFARFNGKMGRQTADEVLRMVADVLGKNTRATDTVGRVGGDEFAVLLPETDPDGAMAVLWKLRRRMQRAMDKRRWHVTFSIGAVTFTRAPRDAEDIVRHADRLVVAVKLDGKNQVRHETVVGARRASA